MGRVVYIAGIGKWVSLKEYIRGIKVAKANPQAVFSYGLDCWWSCTGAEIMEQFLAGVMDRINERISYIERGKSYGQRISSKEGGIDGRTEGGCEEGCFY